MLIACIVIFLPALVLLVIRMEGESPGINFEPTSRFIGLNQQLTVDLQDQKSGLKRFWVGILQDGTEHTLLDKYFPSTGILKKGTALKTSIPIIIDPQKTGLKDGDAMLRMMAVDYSWRSWGKGNRTYTEKDITIDTQAPLIKVLSRSHNISPGGSNAVVYEVSEPCESSGVQIEDRRYPGYPLSGETESARRVAFFALNHQQRSGTPMAVVAVDRAGNRSTVAFPHYIKFKRFKNDTIRIGDSFILGKLPEFKQELAGQEMTSNLDKFLFVNRDVRAQNMTVIRRIMQQSDPEVYWKGSFLRLPKSATRSGFGDRRTYRYQGKTIDHQTHLGIDLASLAHSAIPAANTGKVVYADRLGIYGRMLVIDHGCGLFSMYAHLSSFTASVGQMVEKGAIIGHTGTSGLAGGDHLHFSVLVSGTFVNPIEWWDPSWIVNNITSKIERLGDSS